MKGKTLAAAVMIGCLAAPASALETLDEIHWPETGWFPAYPAERDPRPLRFFVQAGIDHDSNIFRLADGTNTLAAIGSTSRSDTIYRGGVGLRGDLLSGRQRFIIDALVEYRDYDRFDLLDHTHYRAAGTWRWEVGNQWSGDIGYRRRRFLSDLGDIQARIKDMITEDRFSASAGYLVTPRWRVRGALDWTRIEHDEPTRIALDTRITATTAGVDYVTPAGNWVGGQVRYTEGEYPNRAVVGAVTILNDYEETETSVVVRWIPTGKSTINARAGYTSREHKQVPQRDFDGFTGRFSYDWFIAPKTLLNFAVWRELRSIEFADASYVLTEGWGIAPAWAPTNKLVFQARYFNEDRDYRGNPALAVLGTTPREDTVKGVSLTVGYTPQRNLLFSFGIERGDRSSNFAGANYDYTLYSANARLRF